MILCAGEALIDMIPDRTAGGEVCFVPRSGGAAFNSALALGRLGEEVALATGLASDVFGTQLARDAAASGVSVAPSGRSDRPTSLAIVTLVDGIASYVFHDRGTALRDSRIAEFALEGVAPAACLLGGMSLAGGACAETFEVLAAEMRARGALIVLDPNVRPAFIDDAEACRARLARMVALADVVKVSDEDLDWLGPGNGEAAAAALLEAGPALVCLTRGAEGAVLLRPDDRIPVPAVPVARVVDTVGAGDTFNAGFLAGLQRQGALSRATLAAMDAGALQAAAGLGAAAAAVCVTRAGANPPWARELPAQS